MNPNAFEVLACIPVLVLAFLWPGVGDRSFRRLGRTLSHVAGRRTVAILLVGTTSLAINASMGLFVHLPVPAVHDEFSYLLAADTFAHGRLTNPTHPLWEHFESYHTIQHPTYQSKYPPGQGLALAAGQVLFGHPITGVWMSLAAACAATCWMLQAWVPPRWALLGGLLVVFNPQMLVHWGQTYYGGAVAMLGGALVFGALRRIVRRPGWRAAVVLSVGLVLLANSRPYEGLVASLPAAAVLLTWTFGNGGRHLRFALPRVILPITAALLPAAAWMGHYNWSVTGHAFLMPYQVWTQQRLGTEISDTLFSSVTGLKARPESYIIGASDEVSRQVFQEVAAGRDSLAFAISKTRTLYGFFIGPALLIPLVVLPQIARQPWGLFAIVTCGLVLLALLLTTAHGLPYNAAPATSLIAAILVQGLRFLRHFRFHGRPTGRFLARLLPLVRFGASIVLLVLFWIPDPVTPVPWSPSHGQWSLRRAEIQDALTRDGDKHLVVVRYGREYTAGGGWHDEWVYNGADIDSAAVVWARDLGPERNGSLLESLQGRRAWLLEANIGGWPLVPYPGTDSEASVRIPQD